MDKPAILSALEADPRMIDYAGMAMYKIREPKGSTRLTFEQISTGKKNRNRELAISVINQVLQRYPDPQHVQSVDEVKDFMADIMYRTLAPNKAEDFPLDQRTPFAKAYYREKAEGFFYDFLSPLAAYSQSELPASTPGRLRANTSESLPQSQPTPKPLPTPPTPAHKTISSPKKSPSIPASTSGKETAKTGPSSKASPSIHKNEPSHVDSGESQYAYIGCLLMLIVVLLIVLVVRTF